MAWSFVRPWRELQVDVIQPWQGQRLLKWQNSEATRQALWQKDQIRDWWTKLLRRDVKVLASSRLNPLFRTPETWDYEGAVKHSHVEGTLFRLQLANGYYLEAIAQSLELDLNRNMLRLQTAVGRTYWFTLADQTFNLANSPLAFGLREVSKSLISQGGYAKVYFAYADSRLVYETPLALQDLTSAWGISLGMAEGKISSYTTQTAIGIRLAAEEANWLIHEVPIVAPFGITAEEGVITFSASALPGLGAVVGLHLDVEIQDVDESFTPDQYNVLALDTFGDYLFNTFFL